MVKPKLEYIWKAYRAILKGSSETDLMVVLGLTGDELTKYMSWAPFKQAVEAAKEDRKNVVTNPVEMESWLDDSAKAVWMDLKDLDDTLGKRQKALVALADCGDFARQRMFVYAMLETHFDVNKCCKILKITKNTLDKWARDTGFQEMLESVQWSKRNFAEASLMKLVAAGNDKAVIAANKALNRETYGDQLQVNGTIAQVPGLVDLTKLDLPLELQIKILEALKKNGMIDNEGLLVQDQKLLN